MDTIRSTLNMIAQMAAMRYKQKKDQTTHHPLRRIKNWYGVLLIAVTLLTTSATADSGLKIVKIPYAQLNEIITQKDGNHLIAFMAAWCRPCKEELPILNRLHHRFRNQEFRLIGISVDSGSPAAMERILKKKGIDFPVYWVGESAVDKLQLVGIPMIFLIKNGRIVEKIPGKCSYRFLEGKIMDLIK